METSLRDNRTLRPIIRLEKPGDAAAIHAVTIAAFRHAPHTDHTEQFVVDALRAEGALSISLVAEADVAVVGHAAVSPVSISDFSADWFGVGPVSVLPEFQGQGIGSLLMHEVLRVLRNGGAAGCVVLGDPVFYRRFGFLPEANVVLPGVPPAYFQAIAFGQTLPRGVVAYHAAFGAGG